MLLLYYACAYLSSVLLALRRGEEYNPQWECQTDDHPDEPGKSSSKKVQQDLIQLGR